MAKGTDRPATLAKRRSYADFLELDTLLGLQHSFADSDDDLLHNERCCHVNVPEVAGSMIRA